MFRIFRKNKKMDFGIPTGEDLKRAGGDLSLAFGDDVKVEAAKPKIDRFLIKNRWLIAPILYLVVCVWTFFTATLSIGGNVLPQAEAGMYGLLTLHVMGLIAVVGAYVLHWIVELISKLFK